MMNNSLSGSALIVFLGLGISAHRHCRDLLLRACVDGLRDRDGKSHYGENSLNSRMNGYREIWMTRPSNAMSASSIRRSWDRRKTARRFLRRPMADRRSAAR